MGLRFRKRISLGKFGHINLSATGISFSVGPRDANINIGGLGPNRHPRVTVGIPGTGLYYQQQLGSGSPAQASQAAVPQVYSPTNDEQTHNNPPDVANRKFWLVIRIWVAIIVLLAIALLSGTH